MSFAPMIRGVHNAENFAHVICTLHYTPSFLQDRSGHEAQLVNEAMRGGEREEGVLRRGQQPQPRQAGRHPNAR